MAIAIGIGGYLRFAHLSAMELSADEGASWAAASADPVTEVLRLQAHLNPGELGLHDVVLHLWMRWLGDSLAAMRSLSALSGLIAIGLVFLVARQVLALSPKISTEDDEKALLQEADLIAAIGALLFAVNLVTIKYSREARMYPLALALTLAQVWFFLRSLRDGRSLSHVALSVFTALAIAATFSAGLILVPEGIYLLFRVARDRDWPAFIAIVASLTLGLILIIPALIADLHFRGGAPNPNTWDWIPRPAAWSAVSLFNKASGTYLFPLIAILALLGIARRWAVDRAALIFLLLWMFAPPLLLTMISYAWRPAFVERYLLSSFVPFFILAAIGLMNLEPVRYRSAALAIIVAIAIGHVVGWERKPHGPEWKKAAEIAVAILPPNGAVGVTPHYAVNVIRYDVRRRDPAPNIEAADADPPPAIVIALDSIAQAQAADLMRQYPSVLGRTRDLTIYGR